jgi:hypothetical protein
MNDANAFRELTVKVNQGSGCLFQTESELYSYVLTAKHNITDPDNIVIKKIILSNTGELIIKNIDIIGGPYLHQDINKDAAIIKVEKQESIPCLLRASLITDSKDEFFLCGHPGVRDGSDSFRLNNLRPLNKKEFGYVEAELIPTATHEEISGQSGGGILQYNDEHHYLIGIQKGMAASDNDETLSRVNFMPLSFYDEIIRDHTDDLLELVPPFIASFKNIVNSTYNLDGFIYNKTLVQNELRAIANDISEGISPQDIISEYGNKFLIYGEEDNSIYNETLWIGMLELLTLAKIHLDKEDNLSILDIPNINKKSRVFFGSVSKNWHEIIPSLYKSDLSDVEKNGNIFIITSKDKTPNPTVIKPTILSHIANVSPNRIKINNNSVSNPFEDLKIKHIYDIQRIISERNDLFLDTNANTIAETLENETKDII